MKEQKIPKPSQEFLRFRAELVVRLYVADFFPKKGDTVLAIEHAYVLVDRILKIGGIKSGEEKIKPKG